MSVVKDKSEKRKLWWAIATYCYELQENAQKNNHPHTHKFTHPPHVTEKFVRLGLRAPNNQKGLEKFIKNFIDRTSYIQRKPFGNRGSKHRKEQRQWTRKDSIQDEMDENMNINSMNNINNINNLNNLNNLNNINNMHHMTNTANLVNSISGSHIRIDSPQPVTIMGNLQLSQTSHSDHIALMNNRNNNINNNRNRNNHQNYNHGPLLRQNNHSHNGYNNNNTNNTNNINNATTTDNNDNNNRRRRENKTRIRSKQIHPKLQNTLPAPANLSNLARIQTQFSEPPLHFNGNNNNNNNNNHGNNNNNINTNNNNSHHNQFLNHNNRGGGGSNRVPITGRVVATVSNQVTSDGNNGRYQMGGITHAASSRIRSSSQGSNGSQNSRTGIPPPPAQYYGAYSDRYHQNHQNAQTNPLQRQFQYDTNSYVTYDVNKNGMDMMNTTSRVGEMTPFASNNNGNRNLNMRNQDAPPVPSLARLSDFGSAPFTTAQHAQRMHLQQQQQQQRHMHMHHEHPPNTQRNQHYPAQYGSQAPDEFGTPSLGDSRSHPLLLRPQNHSHPSENQSQNRHNHGVAAAQIAPQQVQRQHQQHQQHQHPRQHSQQHQQQHQQQQQQQHQVQGGQAIQPPYNQHNPHNQRAGGAGRVAMTPPAQTMLAYIAATGGKQNGNISWYPRGHGDNGNTGNNGNNSRNSSAEGRVTVHLNNNNNNNLSGTPSAASRSNNLSHNNQSHGASRSNTPQNMTPLSMNSASIERQMGFGMPTNSLHRNLSNSQSQSHSNSGQMSLQGNDSVTTNLTGSMIAQQNYATLESRNSDQLNNGGFVLFTIEDDEQDGIESTLDNESKISSDQMSTPTKPSSHRQLVPPAPPNTGAKLHGNGTSQSGSSSPGISDVESGITSISSRLSDAQERQGNNSDNNHNNNHNNNNNNNRHNQSHSHNYNQNNNNNNKNNNNSNMMDSSRKPASMTDLDQRNSKQSQQASNSTSQLFGISIRKLGYTKAKHPKTQTKNKIKTKANIVTTKNAKQFSYSNDCTSDIEPLPRTPTPPAPGTTGPIVPAVPNSHSFPYLDHSQNGTNETMFNAKSHRVPALTMQNNLTMGNVYSDSYASNQTKITVSQLGYPQSEEFTNTAQYNSNIPRKHRSHNYITGQDNNNNPNGNNNNNREMRSHASSDQILNGTGEELSKLVPASHIRMNRQQSRAKKPQSEISRMLRLESSYDIRNNLLSGNVTGDEKDDSIRTESEFANDSYRNNNNSNFDNSNNNNSINYDGNNDELDTANVASESSSSDETEINFISNRSGISADTGIGQNRNMQKYTNFHKSRKTLTYLPGVDANNNNNNNESDQKKSQSLKISVTVTHSITYKIGYLNVSRDSPRMLFNFCRDHITIAESIAMDKSGRSKDNPYVNNLDAIVVFEPTQAIEVLKMYTKSSNAKENLLLNRKNRNNNNDKNSNNNNSNNNNTSNDADEKNTFEKLKPLIESGLNFALDSCLKYFNKKILNKKSTLYQLTLKRIIFVSFAILPNEMTKMASALYELYLLRAEKMKVFIDNFRNLCEKTHVSFETVSIAQNIMNSNDDSLSTDGACIQSDVSQLSEATPPEFGSTRSGSGDPVQPNQDRIEDTIQLSLQHQQHSLQQHRSRKNNTSIADFNVRLTPALNINRDNNNNNNNNNSNGNNGMNGNDRTNLRLTRLTVNNNNNYSNNNSNMKMLECLVDENDLHDDYYRAIQAEIPKSHLILPSLIEKKIKQEN